MTAVSLGTSLIIEDQLPKVLPEYSLVEILSGSTLPFNYTQLNAASTTPYTYMNPELWPNQASPPKECSLFLMLLDFTCAPHIVVS